MSNALAEDPEHRCADIKIWVEAECDYFGIEPKNDPVADQITQILYDHENRQHERGRDAYDVTDEDRRRLDRVIERGIAAAADERDEVALELAAETEVAETAAEVSATEAEASATEEAETNEESYRALLGSVEYRNASNAEKIAMMSNHPDVPESERAKWQSFGRILSIAAAAPEDHAVIATRLNQLDLSQGAPDPVGFARAFIFDSPNSQLSSGISEATQAAIAETLGIERPALDVTTGSDMTDVFENGVGTRTVVDPETGETREEPIFLQPGEFEEIRDGQSIGLTPTGDRAMRFEEEAGDFTIRLPDNATAEDMALYGLTGQMMSRLHAVNMGEIFFPGRSQLERGGGTLDIRMPGDFHRAQRLSQIFFGGLAGHDGELLDQSDLNRIPYLMQFQNERGDAVIGDVDPERMMADYRQQGLVDASNQLDWDRFAEMVEANRMNLWTEENFSHTAQAA
ncbi:hypothetical protein [Nioella sp. MMSF_3534]|uniref:hypothetical protein n=1 Tax=Nioella sp. MMSF_3534 TaxID=3046720 RepID=UPI00273D5D5D|nr:hypothetical protein [Nioella sp. MMSF_3534]